MKHCQRIFAIILAILIFTLSSVGAAPREKVKLTAEAGIVIDRETRRVLYEEDAHKILPMASTTKIMTALLALELGSEDDMVVASKKAAATEGSSIWLEAGEEKSLSELIYGLMLLSGNDAAVAIAEHIGGSVKEFSVLMNEKAVELGAKNTNFTNPHGLPDDNHYTTAYDLALIAAAALDNERFREIITTPYKTITWPGHEFGRALVNQNRLLELYPGGDGVKTGWTKKAGRCFVGSATREEWQLVSVVLNAPQMWEDTAALLDYGFQAYARENVLYRGQVVRSDQVYKGDSRVKVVVDRDFAYPLFPGERENIRYHFTVKEQLTAPLKEGKNLGTLEMYLNDELIGTVNLLAGHGVGRLPFKSYLEMLWNEFFR